MNELRGRAVRAVPVPAEACFARLAAVDRYADWLEFVQVVEVLDRDQAGRPLRVRARLHVAQSPIGQDFELVLAVAAEPPTDVRLRRLATDSSDREQLALNWSLNGDGGTRIELEFLASVSFLPRFLPLGGVGDLIAATIVESAAVAVAER